MYESETASQQPLNQHQTNDGHFRPKPSWLVADAVWSGCSSQKCNNHLSVAVLQSECTDFMMLTNGQETSVMNAPRSGLFKYTFLQSWELTVWRCQPAQTNKASTHFRLIISAPMTNYQPTFWNESAFAKLITLM